jgi:hypothetical protein
MSRTFDDLSDADLATLMLAPTIETFGSAISMERLARVMVLSGYQLMAETKGDRLAWEMAQEVAEFLCNAAMRGPQSVQ